MNIQPLLDVLDLQEKAAHYVADELHVQIEDLHGRLQETQVHLEHLAITRKTVLSLADLLPDGPSSPELPDPPGRPRILSVLNEATDPLRARNGREALDPELLPKRAKSTRAKPKRLVKLDTPAETDTGSVPTKQ
ncbi:hypothetical protein [Kitasatospora sp. NPDC004531]